MLLQFITSIFRLGQVNEATKFMDLDGLNSPNYTLKDTVFERLYTKFTVDLPGPKTILDAKTYFKNRTKYFFDLMKKSNQTKKA